MKWKRKFASNFIPFDYFESYLLKAYEENDQIENKIKKICEISEYLSQNENNYFSSHIFE
jgi:hypothetical protein